MKNIVLILLLSMPLGVSVCAQTANPVPGSSPPTDAAKITRQGTSLGTDKRPITLTDAVSIFLQQNLQLVAARYDIDLADAEKLTARLRPNPEITIESADIPPTLGGFYKPQTFDYNIEQTLELGGKRQKRINAAQADAEVARAGFEVILWQLTNDVKKKYYAVLLAQSLLDLARENEKTFQLIVDHTTDVFKSGEISGLDLQRLEVEKLKFDTDLANAERDYEVALRDLRVTISGNYDAMDIQVTGSIEYYQSYDFTFSDLRDKALVARPDLKSAQLSERAADAAITLQNAQRIPDIAVGAGFEQVPAGGNTYNLGVTIPLPVFNRNQGERAKALIQKSKAQNDQRLLTNQIIGDVDKAFISFQIQKRRLDLYRSGIMTKVTNIERMTEFSLKSGESSTLELLDAIRTRRDTIAGFYQAIFDYESSLLELELATATPLLK